VSLPVKVDLYAYRGDSWEQTFRLLRGPDPIDLTGADVACEARDRAGSLVELTVGVPDPPSGEITVRLPADSVPPGGYSYDIEITDSGGVVTTWVKGSLTVARDVTNELPGGGARV
jgi:hypothetical protein